MKVYFVRHAESESSASGFHQNSLSGLSTRGKKQAAILAERFSRIKIDLILSSPFVRAKETAEIINKPLKRPIRYLDSLKELKRPTEVEGKKIDDPEIIEIKKLVVKNFSKKDWHYSDGENFYDLKKRGEETIKYLLELKEENVLLVTHGIIMRMIISLMMFGDVSPKEYLRFFRFALMSNTGITLCEYIKRNRWILVTWNDHAHLG
jgi:broad specificity phosphatase PhoE